MTLGDIEGFDLESHDATIKAGYDQWQAQAGVSHPIGWLDLVARIGARICGIRDRTKAEMQ